MIRQLVVALDGSDLSEAVLPHAVKLAERLEAALNLVRVHVPVFASVPQPLAPVVPPSPALDLEIQTVARTWLEDCTARIRAQTRLAVRSELRVGQPVDEIVALARAVNALAVVCTTHGSGGWAAEWIGSVCDGIIRRAACPVLALGSKAVARDPGVHRIMVPLDGTVGADAALPEATVLARALGARLELFRVVAPAWLGETLLLTLPEGRDPLGVDSLAVDAKATLDGLAGNLRAEGIDASAVVAIDRRPIRGVLKRIEEADPDLVVVASEMRGASRLLVPSLADRVLRAGGRATLVVREGAQSHPPWRDDVVSGEMLVGRGRPR